MYDKIIKELKSFANEEKRKVLMRFFRTGKGEYGEGDLFLGVTVPQIRSIVKEHWEDCKREDVERLVTSKYHEERMTGLLILVRQFRKAVKRDRGLADEIAAYYLSRTAYINNWDLVDLSCYEIIGLWVLKYPEKAAVIGELSRSANMWEQRISIVSTMQLIRHGDTSMTYSIADTLLHHKHDLIHKAVGWLLREAGKRDAEKLVAFLAPRYRTMPRTMLRYAIEKFEPEERRRYLTGEA